MYYSNKIRNDSSFTNSTRSSNPNQLYYDEVEHWVPAYTVTNGPEYDDMRGENRVYRKTVRKEIRIIKRLTFSFPRVTKVSTPGEVLRQLVINRHAGGYQRYRRNRSWAGRNFCRHERQ